MEHFGGWRGNAPSSRIKDTHPKVVETLQWDGSFWQGDLDLQWGNGENGVDSLGDATGKGLWSAQGHCLQCWGN